jgi:hypothetical protein
MADEIERRVIYLEINATKAVDGSAAATRALAAIDQGASSAGSALGALEAASNAARGAVQKTAIDLATAAQSATNLNTAYRTTAGGVLELARAATSAASSAQAQAAGFARLTGLLLRHHAQLRFFQWLVHRRRSESHHVKRKAAGTVRVGVGGIVGRYPLQGNAVRDRQYCTHVPIDIVG